MFFTRKIKAEYDRIIADLRNDLSNGLRSAEDQVAAEIARLDARITTTVEAIAKQPVEAVEYEIKRVTENDEAAAQRESA